MAFGGAGEVLNILRMGIRPGLRGNASISGASLALNDLINPISPHGKILSGAKIFGASRMAFVAGMTYEGVAGSISRHNKPSEAFMSKPGTMPRNENMTLALHNLNRVTSGTSYRNIDAMQAPGHGFYSGRMR